MYVIECQISRPGYPYRITPLWYTERGPAVRAFNVRIKFRIKRIPVAVGYQNRTVCGGTDKLSRSFIMAIGKHVFIGDGQTDEYFRFGYRIYLQDPERKIFHYYGLLPFR